jgi:hypothetical protein
MTAPSVIPELLVIGIRPAVWPPHALFLPQVTCGTPDDLWGCNWTINVGEAVVLAALSYIFSGAQRVCVIHHSLRPALEGTLLERWQLCVKNTDEELQEPTGAYLMMY